MANEKRDAAFTGGASGAITAAMIVALMNARRVGAEPPEGSTLVTLDAPAMQAVLGILQRSENIDVDMDSVLQQLAGVGQSIADLTAVLSTLLGNTNVMHNPPTIVAWRSICVAATTAYQLPSREIPFDKALVIKALPTNIGVIYVGNTAAASLNVNDSYPLIANEAIMYKIKDSQKIWISGSMAGDGVACTVEQAV